MLNMKNMINEMAKSGDSLRYDFNELDGWMNRLAKQYGYNTLRRVVAAGVKMNPSPTLDSSYKAWACTVPIPRGAPDIPFFALQYMAHCFMKKEGFAPADQAKRESIPVEASRNRLGSQYISTEPD